VLIPVLWCQACFGLVATEEAHLITAAQLPSVRKEVAAAVTIASRFEHAMQVFENSL
jgi:hypothetical protein